jgi:hypothetical protein
MPLPEPIAGMTVLGAGWLLGKLDRWVHARSSTDSEQATALALLTQSLTHLDKSIGRLDVSLDRLWDRCNDHETRLSSLEGRQDR